MPSTTLTLLRDLRLTGALCLGVCLVGCGGAATPESVAPTPHSGTAGTAPLAATPEETSAPEAEAASSAEPEALAGTDVTGDSETPADPGGSALPETSAASEASALPETPEDVSARLFARALWVAEQRGRVVFMLRPERVDGGLWVNLCESEVPGMCLGDDDSPVSVEGSTLRFEIVAYGDTPEPVVLRLAGEQSERLDVVEFPRVPRGTRRPRRFRAVDVIEQLLWAQENDLGHNDGGSSAEAYAFERGFHDAVRRGVVRAGVDPLELEASAALDLCDAAMDAVTEDQRQACRPLAPASCARLYELVSATVAAALAAE